MSITAALWTALYTLLLALPALSSKASEPENSQLQAVLACRQEMSPLLRLDCYDQSLIAAEQGAALPTRPVKMPGADWQRAMAQERQRQDHSTTFLVSNSGGDNPQVVLTTPAIGVAPPRPVLMLSCVDNITRLQIALATPYQSKESTLTLTTGQTQFNVQWFIRDAGFLLESSRGLSGIDDIRRLLGNKTLTLTSEKSALRLVFNIDGLSQAIVPLRQTCRW